MYKLLIPIYEKYRKEYRLDSYPAYIISDKESLSQYAGKYIWQIRECGTDLYKLPSLKESFFPPNYPFSEDHKSPPLTLTYYRDHQCPCKFFYFNGERVVQISGKEAVELWRKWADAELQPALKHWANHWFEASPNEIKKGLLMGLKRWKKAVTWKPVFKQLKDEAELYEITGRHSPFIPGYDVKEIMYKDFQKTVRMFHRTENKRPEERMGGRVKATIYYWFK